MNQHQEILQILKQCGKSGMNSWLYRRKFIQLPVRIKELKEKGYLIVSKRNEDTSVNYILLSKDQTKEQEVQNDYIWIFEGNVAKRVLKSDINKQQSLM